MAANYNAATETLKRCRKRAGVADWLRKQEALRTANGLTLDSCLIKPVQRLTKYPLFFKELLAHLPLDHAARDALERAEALVVQVSHAVNGDIAEEVNGIRTCAPPRPPLPAAASHGRVARSTRSPCALASQGTALGGIRWQLAPARRTAPPAASRV